MNYWLTIHWPPNVGKAIFQEPEAVYVPEGKEHFVSDIAIRDKVVVYELAKGDSLLGWRADGSLYFFENQQLV